MLGRCANCHFLSPDLPGTVPSPRCPLSTERGRAPARCEDDEPTASPCPEPVEDTVVPLLRQLCRVLEFVLHVGSVMDWVGQFMDWVGHVLESMP